MDYMPFFFDLRQRDCLIIGGGSVATQQARLLAKAGAELYVVAPSITDELQAMVKESGGECTFRDYQSNDLSRGHIIIGATNVAVVNQQVSKDAQALRLPVNIVDDSTLSSVMTPTIIDRSPLMIAISSGGEAPVLEQQMRAKLEVVFPAAYGTLAKVASRFRARVKENITSETKRLRFWEKVFSSSITEKILSGNEQEAENDINNLLDNTHHKKIDKELSGEVYLVGGGPGDPDLLTFKALRLMQQADVVLYDRLVSDAVMNLVRRDAERVYVGKRTSDHSVPQQEINQRLVDLAKQGKRVLRLKGGDPFIFGRGGEEIELLAENNIPFQVVPGITAASGCAAYSGIPLTHRDHAQSVRFITGHTKEGNVDLPWDSLLDERQTLVFYMGLVNLSPICAQLIAHGRDPQTPAALIEKGTTPDQQVIVGNLSSLPELILQQTVEPPTLLIIGGVVSLHKQLNWYR